jgi:hypothetical protein
MRSWFAVLAVVLFLAGCGAEPPAPSFTSVALPDGAVPETLTAYGDGLLIGVRRDDRPALLRLDADGTIEEIPVRPASGYGREAMWYSIATDGPRILAIGGKRGGAHGNVRWSVWTGDHTGLTEQAQVFSTFGGLGAGDLIDAVLSPSTAALVGTWSSDSAGLDAAVWTAKGDVWTRLPSAGTPLASARESLKFPMAATALADGALVAGWQLADGGTQIPTVWRSTAGVTGWTMSPLPDAGDAGTAVAVRCWAQTCGIAGRVDGMLAVWRLAGATWTRLPGEPRIPVADADRLAAPFEVDGQLTQVASDGGSVRIARHDGTKWTVETVTGPTSPVTAATTMGDTIHVLAGDELLRAP